MCTFFGNGIGATGAQLSVVHIDHIRQLSSHERRVTCQWCHMGAHPRHYNTPPMGAHPRGRLLDAARATFTDPATPEDGSTTDTHHASLLLQLRLQFYLATSAHYRMDLDTRSYA